MNESASIREPFRRTVRVFDAASHRPHRMRSSAFLIGLAFSALPATLLAQPSKASRPAPARSPSPVTAASPLRSAAAGSARGAAWGLPDADALVQRVYARIVAQDKPGAVPIRDYQRRFVGREATLDAVRRFSGRAADLDPSAFTAVDGWTDANKLTLPLCEGPGCPAPVNSIWLAITKIERGELPHELHVWYTTSFAAESPSGPQQNTYAFCERWLRVGGGWKYDGFVRVRSGG